MNLSFKGRLAITNQAAADEVAKKGKRTDGLYRFLIAGDKVLLCRGNEVVAASPLSQAEFRVKIDDLTPPE